jgi:hypothetical protein
MIKRFALGITLISTSILLIESSCNRSITTAGGATNSTTIATQASTLRNGQLPAIEFKPEDMNDFDKNQPRVSPLSYDYADLKYLHIVNGEVLLEKKKAKILKKLSSQLIESYQFIPADQAMEFYGEKGAYGAVIIRTKKG